MRYKEFRINAQPDYTTGYLDGVYIDRNYVHIRSKPGVASSNVNSTARVTIPEDHPFFNLDICSHKVDDLLELKDSLFFSKKYFEFWTNVIKKWFPTVSEFYTKYL
jgi:hypothetical protein